MRMSIDLHGAVCRLVTPDEWRTMLEEGRLRIIDTRHGYVVGTLQDHSLVAVKDLFSPIAVDTPMPLQLKIQRWKQKDIAKKYGVSPQHVSKVIRGERRVRNPRNQPPLATLSSSVASTFRVPSRPHADAST